MEGRGGGFSAAKKRKKCKKGDFLGIWISIFLFLIGNIIRLMRSVYLFPSGNKWLLSVAPRYSTQLCSSFWAKWRFDEEHLQSKKLSI